MDWWQCARHSVLINIFLATRSLESEDVKFEKGERGKRRSSREYRGEEQGRGPREWVRGRIGEQTRDQSGGATADGEPMCPTFIHFPSLPRLRCAAVTSVQPITSTRSATAVAEIWQNEQNRECWQLCAVEYNRRSPPAAITTQLRRTKSKSTSCVRVLNTRADSTADTLITSARDATPSKPHCKKGSVSQSHSSAYKLLRVRKNACV